MCVRVCEKESESKLCVCLCKEVKVRWRESVCLFACGSVYLCVCTCVYERNGEREKERGMKKG